MTFVRIYLHMKNAAWETPTRHQPICMYLLRCNLLIVFRMCLCHDCVLHYILCKFSLLRAEQFALDARKRLGRLYIHLLGEAEIGDAGNVVAADLRRVGTELAVGKIHLAQRLENAVEVDLALTHREVLMDGHIRTPMIVEPRRICDVAAESINIECNFHRNNLI